MSDLGDTAVEVGVGDDGYLSISGQGLTMKRGLDENGLEEIGEEPDQKRLRLEITEDGTVVSGGHIIQEVTEIEDGSGLQVEESHIIQEPQEVPLADDGVVIQEEVIHHQHSPPQYQNLIIQHMDIAEPLSTLKQLLELRLQCSLSDHQFYLQDSIPLDTKKSLVDQCVQGDGMVQINLEVKSQPGMKPKINILDILKPAEEVEPTIEQTLAPVQTNQNPAKVVVPVPEETENITRWIVDQNFRREQDRLKIPYDPVQWSEVHVKHWIQWAVKEFSLDGVDIENFDMNGQALCDMTHGEFVKYIPNDRGDIFWTHLELLRKCKFVDQNIWTQWAVKEFSLDGVDIDNFDMNGQALCDMTHGEFVKYIPNDRGDIFWTHLELLRKCKFVAVMQQPAPQAVTTITVSTSGKRQWKHNKTRSPRITGDHGFSPGNRTGNNGQIQLWQFLLELLTDKDCREVIQWVGEDGEFKLNNPEMVAQMWGQRKNKPTMNYEKLSRALRYYYDGDMIAKVHGKRFVYKFVCDLKMLLGYSAAELNRQVTMCAEKKLQRVREAMRPVSAKQKVTTQTVQTTLD